MFGILISGSLIQSAIAGFVVNKIEVEGNKRISFETIRSYLPVDVGDTLTSQLAAESLK